ncbi:hypothetical protein WN943_016622 [Citrus x changshan-huyou]
MIQLLFLVLFAEGALAFLLLVKIGPLRELVIKSLDQLKMGKGPATVKTIAGTMFVILLSSLMSIVKIQNKGAKLGTMSPMDQVLWRTHLLEASLIEFKITGISLNIRLGSIAVDGMQISYLRSPTAPLVLIARWKLNLVGFTLFLGFIIDRMHHYLTKLIRLRSNAGSSKEEVEQLQKEKMQLKDKEEKASKELKRLQEEISTLSVNLKKLKSECEQKDKQIETADAHVIALQKQSADLLLEYDRLLEDNQNLQKQAQGYKS